MRARTHTVLKTHNHSFANAAGLSGGSVGGLPHLLLRPLVMGTDFPSGSVRNAAVNTGLHVPF